MGWLFALMAVLVLVGSGLVVSGEPMPAIIGASFIIAAIVIVGAGSKNATAPLVRECEAKGGTYASKIRMCVNEIPLSKP